MNDSNDTRPGSPAAGIIDILVVLDVEAILQESSKTETDTSAPTSMDPSRGYMLVTGAGDVTNQGSADVAIGCREGDTFRFFATSGSANYEHCVLLVDIRPHGGDAVLGAPERTLQERTAMAPPMEPGEFLVQCVPRTFWFLHGEVAREGAGDYCLEFALYDRDERGQPRFTGLYQYNARFTVHRSPSSPEASTRSQQEEP